MEGKVTISQIGLKYGLITGLVMVIYNLALYMTGLFTNDKLSWVIYIIIAVLVFLAHKAFKEGGDSYMSIGQGLGIGMLLILIGGIISSIFSYVYIKFVDDTIIEQIIDVTRIKMEEKGLDDDQIEQAMSMTEKFMTPEMMMVFGILGILFIGFIITLIVSLFTKKNNPQAEF